MMETSNNQPVDSQTENDEYDESDDISIKSLFSSLESNDDDDDTFMEKSVSESPSNSISYFQYPSIQGNLQNELELKSQTNGINIQNIVNNIVMVKPKSSNYLVNLNVKSPIIKESKSFIILKNNQHYPVLQANLNNKSVPTKIFLNKSEHYVAKNDQAAQILPDHNRILLQNKPRSVTTFSVNNKNSATLTKSRLVTINSKPSPTLTKVVYMNPPSAKQVLIVKTPQISSQMPNQIIQKFPPQNNQLFSFPSQSNQPETNGNYISNQNIRIMSIAPPTQHVSRIINYPYIQNRNILQTPKQQYLFPVVDKNAKIIYSNSNTIANNINNQENSVKFLKIERKKQRSHSDFNYTTKKSTPYFFYSRPNL